MKIDMRRAPLLAVSLVGMSCASPGRGGGFPYNVIRKLRPTPAAAAPARVSQAQLGSLTVSKYRLENGLEIILAPDPAATSVAYTTWFRVGSRHENAAAGETGLAHLFEHLMFTQTKSARAAGEFDQRMEEVGGNVNAMTSYDFTAYTDDMPPDAVPLAITLEADRMVNLALTKKQVETEREVVAEERLSSVEDSVEGLLDEMMHLQSFKQHPYRFPVIGLMKDIKAVTTEKAVGFYRTYYAPNNAVLVVAGKLDEAATLKTIAAAYGGLEPSKLPTEATAPERAPASPVRAEVVRPVAADRFVLGAPAPGLADPDRAAYELLAEVLAGGPSSRLYRRLVIEDEVASSVSGDVPPTRDPSIYGLWVQMTKGHTSAEAEAVIEPELARLVNQPVPAAELDRARAQLETGLWRGLTSSEGRAEALGEYEVCAGDYRKLFGRAADYGRVSPDDLQRVARAYLAPESRAVVVAKPKPE
jgi:zinc protease